MIAKQRLNKEWHQTMRHVLQGVVNAMALKVEKIPAVVVDKKYIVYGETDVNRALQDIKAYRSSHP